MSKVMCFTGRRPKDLFGYEKALYLPLMEALKASLRTHIQNGYTTFISGGAQGVDQLSFWAVNRLKDEFPHIKNVVYVPFEGQERIWKAEGLFSQQEYRLMLKLADEVRVIESKKPEFKRDIVKALHGRNHAMVASADAVFGIFPDDSWKLPETAGGTAECLKFAFDCGKAIYQLSNSTLQGRWVNVCHADKLPRTCAKSTQVVEQVLKGLSHECLAFSYGSNPTEDRYTSIGKRGKRFIIIVQEYGTKVLIRDNGVWEEYDCMTDAEYTAEELANLCNEIHQYVEDVYNGIG